MNSLARLVGDARRWLPGMQVPDTAYGRYRMCRSAFHPFSLDASSLAADLAYMLDMPVSEPDKDQQAAFFNSLQDPETGFYHEPFVHELHDSPIDRVIEMSGTYLSFQVCGALEAIGRLPRYPFRFYEFTLRAGAIAQYIEERFPWDRAPWGAGAWIDSVATMLRMNIRMGYDAYKMPLNEVLNWLKQSQSPETGLWGNPGSKQGPTGLVNGGYHLLRGTFFQLGMELPYPERVIDTCIQVYEENEYFRPGQGEGCYDLDLFDLLIQAAQYSPIYRREEIMGICEQRIEETLSFQNPDGGFSFFPHRAQTEHNYYCVSPGRTESDVQGTVFYLHTIRRISEHLGLAFEVNRSKTHGYEQ